jgi:hypothetical protein
LVTAVLPRVKPFTVNVVPDPGSKYQTADPLLVIVVLSVQEVGVDPVQVVLPTMLIVGKVPEAGLVRFVVHVQVPDGIVTVFPLPAATAEAIALATSDSLQEAAGKVDCPRTDKQLTTNIMNMITFFIKFFLRRYS